jgi:hypothetical protein
MVDVQKSTTRSARPRWAFKKQGTAVVPYPPHKPQAAQPVRCQKHHSTMDTLCALAYMEPQAIHHSLLNSSSRGQRDGFEMKGEPLAILSPLLPDAA